MHHVNGLRVIQMACEISEESDHGSTEAASTSTCPHKCPRSSPTCLTLRQCQKRTPLRELAASPPNSIQHLEPRRLSYQSDSSHPVKEKWTPTETSALVEFILFHTTGDRWPTHKQMVFWSNAGEYVQTRSASNNYRSGMSKHVNNITYYVGHACRYKVRQCLKKEFPSPKDAKSCYSENQGFNAEITAENTSFYRNKSVCAR